MVDDKEWEEIRKQAKETPGISEWATSIFESPLAWIQEQAVLEVESKEIEKSYIDFLQEQIETNARDEAWLSLLKRRKKALSPYIGKRLIFLSISSTEGDLLWIRFDPANNQVVLVESY